MTAPRRRRRKREYGKRRKRHERTEEREIRQWDRKKIGEGEEDEGIQKGEGNKRK